MVIYNRILNNNSYTKSHYNFTISSEARVADFLAANCPISKTKIKNALQKGAVWLKRTHRKEKRIRKASFALLSGDRLSLYYDEAILALIPPSPRLIAEEPHYSIWFKPALLLSQGSRYGDHCSLLRLATQFFHHRKDIKLVHRLDREAFGLILLAHSRTGASNLTKLFQAGAVEKWYMAEVHGKMGEEGDTFTFTDPLDGKAARTSCCIQSYSQKDDTSKIDIRLHTGRYHQIRRHFSNAGHPIVGDRRYGIVKPATKMKMQLCSYKLKFKCPFTGQRREYTLPSP